MSTFSPPHPAQVPTLTDVIDFQDIGNPATRSPGAPQPPLQAPVPSQAQPAPLAKPASTVVLVEDTAGLEIHITQRVLTDVQRQMDSMLEFRLREAMTPVLARHTEAIVRDLKEELARTMRDVVARSVAQEIAKLRQR